MQKNAFGGALLSAGAKVVGPALKSTFQAAKPVLSSAYQAAKPTISSTISNLGKGISNFSSGTLDGVASMAKGYRALAGTASPISKKIPQMAQWTFGAPWQAAKSTLLSKPLNQVNAADVGRVVGATVPGLGVLNATDKVIDKGLDTLEQQVDKME